ncbi:hypothetical protein T09_11404 [Trichinella sp. T9]|nr:hypothetical protein T09_11404 [Trichinella sp. T9]
MRANKANGRRAMNFRTEKKNGDNDINKLQSSYGWRRFEYHAIRRTDGYCTKRTEKESKGIDSKPLKLYSVKSVCHQYPHLTNRSRKTSLTNNVSICPFSTFVTTFTSVIPKVGDIAPLGAVEGWKGGGKILINYFVLNVKCVFFIFSAHIYICGGGLTALLIAVDQQLWMWN